MKEIELVDKFCDFLKKKGYNFKRELRKGSYHNDGYIDVVIKDDGKFVGIEAKIKNFRGALYQASYVQVLCNYSYILYPILPKKHLDKCRKYGIGLIIPNGNEFKIVIKPKLSLRCYYISKRIIRNWNENRAGRPFSPKELPENYPEERLKELKCTYDWVRKKKKEFKPKIITIDNFL